MAEILPPTMAFGQPDFHQPPQATVSPLETSLEHHMMTPSTPESLYIKDEDDDQDDQKPTKKRKSWGQELPTPKTNLPPRYAVPITVHGIPLDADRLYRKRAKTDDEKEQRRIERVLRNRAAAQSSRERKRQEVEKLEGEKATIEQQNQYLKDRLMAAEHEKFILTQQVAKMSAQMKALKQGSSASTPASASPSLEPQAFDSQKIKQEIDDYPLALPTPQTFSSPSTMTFSPSQSPTQPSLSYDDDSLATSPDMTQHPAEMLCDLQCQSVEVCQAPSTQPTTPLTPPETVIPSFSANPLISMITISAVYSQLMIPLHLIYRSLRTRSPLPRSLINPTSPSTAMILPLIRWLISTPTNLFPTSNRTLHHATATNITSQATTLRLLPTRRLRLLRRLLLSSPSLARPLEDATGRALRVKTSTMTSRRPRPSQGNGSRVVQRSSGKTGLGGGVRSTTRGYRGRPPMARTLMAGFAERHRNATWSRTKRR